MQGHHHWLKSTSHPKTEAGICRQSCCNLQPVSILERSPALNSLSSYCSLYLPTTQLLMLQLFKGNNKAHKRKYPCLQIFPQFPSSLKEVNRLETHRKTQELQKTLLFRRNNFGTIFAGPKNLPQGWLGEAVRSMMAGPDRKRNHFLNPEQSCIWGIMVFMSFSGVSNTTGMSGNGAGLSSKICKSSNSECQL